MGAGVRKQGGTKAQTFVSPEDFPISSAYTANWDPSGDQRHSFHPAWASKVQIS